MIKIFDKTNNEVISKSFENLEDVFNYIEEYEICKYDEVLEVYNEDENFKQTTIVVIEDWGSTVGGLDFYKKKANLK